MASSRKSSVVIFRTLGNRSLARTSRYADVGLLNSATYSARVSALTYSANTCVRRSIINQLLLSLLCSLAHSNSHSSHQCIDPKSSTPKGLPQATYTLTNRPTASGLYRSCRRATNNGSCLCQL